MSESNNIAQAAYIQFSGNSTKSFFTDCPPNALSTGPTTCQWLNTVLQDETGAWNPTYTFNFTNLTSGAGLFGGIQTAFIDNTQCAFPVSIIDGAGLAQSCPAGHQGFFPVQYSSQQNFALIADIPNSFFANIAAGSEGVIPLQTIVNFYNYRIEPRVWNVQEYGTFFYQQEDTPAAALAVSNNETVMVFSGNAELSFGVATLTSEWWDYLTSNEFFPGSFYVKSIEGGYVLLQYSANPNAGAAGVVLVGSATSAFNPPIPSVALAGIGPDFAVNNTSSGYWEQTIPLPAAACSLFVTNDAVPLNSMGLIMLAQASGFPLGNVANLIISLNCRGIIQA